eukprot:Rmarinus@m.10796
MTGGENEGKRKVGKTPLSLDSLDLHTSYTKAPLLTHRSMEACSRQGVAPLELVAKPIEAFQETNTDTAIVEKRWSHYEQRRLDLLELLRWEREAIIREHESKKEKENTYNVDTEFAAAITKEKRNIEKLKARQRSQIEQALLYEIRLHQESEYQQMLLKRQKDKEEEEKRAKDNRQKQWEDYKREREAEKRRLKAEEEAVQRRKAQQEYEKQMQEMTEEKRREQLRRKELVRRELERMRLQEEQRRKTQALFEKQQAELRRKQKQLEMRDSERMRILEYKRRAAAAERQEKRRKQEEKVKLTMENNRRLMTAKRNAFDKKQREEDERRRQWDLYRQAQVMEAKKRGEEKQAQIKAVLSRMEDREEARKNSILLKELESGEAFRLKESERDRIRKEKMEEKRLQKEDKMYKVERNRRMQDYRNKKTLEKIQDDIRRTEMLKMKQNQLQDERARTRDASRLQKRKILQSMEQMRITKTFVWPEGIDMEFDHEDLRRIFQNLQAGSKVSLSELSKRASFLRGARRQALADRPQSTDVGGSGGGFADDSGDEPARAQSALG